MAGLDPAIQFYAAFRVLTAQLAFFPTLVT